MKFSMDDIKRELKRSLNTSEVSQDSIDKQIRAVTSWLFDKGITARDIDIFNCMVRYISEYKLECRSKGLFLFGSVGTGKSFAAKVIASANKIHFYTCRELELKYEKSGDHFRVMMSERKDIVIDDLGTESERNDYGTKFELMERGLDERHRLFEQFGTRTIITSNMSGEDIEKRYSSRIYSRIRQMCECVNAAGKDLRL